MKRIQKISEKSPSENPHAEFTPKKQKQMSILSFGFTSTSKQSTTNDALVAGCSSVPSESWKMIGKTIDLTEDDGVEEMLDVAAGGSSNCDHGVSMSDLAADEDSGWLGKICRGEGFNIDDLKEWMARNNKL